MHGVRLNGFMCITASPLHQSSWNFTGTLLLSQGWALLTLGSKGQRSRSQCIDYWKWLMSHNCFPFTPIIMELNTKTPHESRMCPMDVGVKCQRSRSQCSDYWKWFLAHNCFPFTSAIIKLHAQIPCESRICLTDIGVKNLRSLNWLPRGVFIPLGQPHSSSIWNSKLALDYFSRTYFHLFTFEKSRLTYFGTNLLRKLLRYKDINLKSKTNNCKCFSI